MSNYFLNSESIFEVIGNYPVVDQFDVLYSNLQTGSYLDNYVTGSLLKIATSSLNKIAFTAGERGSAFSKLGVPATSLPTQNTNDTNRSYNLQPWRQRAGIIRNVKIFSDSERFYDSILPNLSEIVKLHGTLISYSGNVLTLELGDYFNKPCAGFLQRFPFEPIFSTASKTIRLSKSFVAPSAVTGEPDIVGDKLLISFTDYQKAEGLSGHSSDYLVSFYPDGYPAGLLPSGALESDVSKVIFGFGDWNSATLFIPGYNHYPVYRSGSNTAAGGYSSIVCSPIIRGWKYGVHDGNPHYTSCMFRRDRFGQFRDMLEQRLEPVSYFDPENSPSRLFDAAEGRPLPNTQFAPQKLSIERPVEVNFVQVSLDKQNKLYYSKIDPNLTRSSNLSTYATSSQPFFDLTRTEIGKNRPIIPDSLLTSVEILNAEI